jgi:hypothetical protein
MKAFVLSLATVGLFATAAQAEPRKMQPVELDRVVAGALIEVNNNEVALGVQIPVGANVGVNACAIAGCAQGNAQEVDTQTNQIVNAGGRP